MLFRNCSCFSHFIHELTKVKAIRTEQKVSKTKRRDFLHAEKVVSFFFPIAREKPFYFFFFFFCSFFFYQNSCIVFVTVTTTIMPLIRIIITMTIKEIIQICWICDHKKYFSQEFQIANSQTFLEWDRNVCINETNNISKFRYIMLIMSRFWPSITLALIPDNWQSLSFWLSKHFHRKNCLQWIQIICIIALFCSERLLLSLMTNNTFFQVFNVFIITILLQCNIQ